MRSHLILALLAAGCGVPQSAGAQMIGDSRAPLPLEQAAPSSRLQTEVQPRRPTFGGQAASADIRRMAEWVAASGDNRALPFLLVDKREAMVFLFDEHSRLIAAAPALLGLGRGDDSVPDIGRRRLATISPAERTTPAGRYEASLGQDLEQDVLWIDYDAALSLHRVIVGRPADRRRERLASATPVDNRISYGCINVPAPFYDNAIVPAFKRTVGIVYILPETRSLLAEFAMDTGTATTAAR